MRITVLLATVLLITAIGQRFHFKSVRVAFMILAFLLLCVPLLAIAGVAATHLNLEEHSHLGLWADSMFLPMKRISQHQPEKPVPPDPRHESRTEDNQDSKDHLKLRPTKQTKRHEN